LHGCWSGSSYHGKVGRHYHALCLLRSARRHATTNTYMQSHTVCVSRGRSVSKCCVWENTSAPPSVATLRALAAQLVDWLGGMSRDGGASGPPHRTAQTTTPHTHQQHTGHANTTSKTCAMQRKRPCHGDVTPKQQWPLQPLCVPSTAKRNGCHHCATQPPASLLSCTADETR
jgi:hypothetical protein